MRRLCLSHSLMRSEKSMATECEEIDCQVLFHHFMAQITQIGKAASPPSPHSVTQTSVSTKNGNIQNSLPRDSNVKGATQPTAFMFIIVRHEWQILSTRFEEASQTFSVAMKNFLRWSTKSLICTQSGTSLGWSFAVHATVLNTHH